jgi:hypothetical protein
MFTGKDAREQHWTPYSYVGNTPLMGVDPDGKEDYIYTSQSNYTVENNWGMFEFLHPDRYFAESNGQRYLANSKETVTEHSWNQITDQKWFEPRLSAALAGNPGVIGTLPYVYKESHAGGLIDQKQNLSSNSLYLFEGEAFNWREAGNVVWGAAIAKLGIPLGVAKIGAEGYKLRSAGTFDERYEVRAYEKGYFSICSMCEFTQ